MSFVLRLLAAMLIAATATTAPAHATPGEATARFEQNLAHVPTHVVEGEITFADAADDTVKITGEFQHGFGEPEPTTYRWVLVDDKGDVVHDLTKELQAEVVVVPPAIEAFEVTLPTTVKDVLGLDFVVYQEINLAGVKLLAETGRTVVERAP
jgi:hypothetical protein